MRRFSLIIFDLDNTIYDWYSAFLPAFYAMVDRASSILQCDREKLLDEMRAVHIAHHDVEHPFSLLETATVKRELARYGNDAVWNELDPAFHDFNRVRKSNLKLFPNTLTTLEKLSGYGITLVAYTDSTYFAAWGRIERLGLSGLFSRIYCRERGSGAQIPPGKSLRALPPRDVVVEIPSHQSKPNPQVLRDIILAQGLNSTLVAYVGDSLVKDVLMAKRAHCFAIWAKYGAYTDPEMYESLVRISHWSENDIQREREYASAAASISPDFICEKSIDEILLFLDAR